MPQRKLGKTLRGKPKRSDLTPRNAMALDTLAGVRSEMSRLYRLGLNGKMPAEDMTKFVYVLKEIRCCLEAELLSDVQARLAAVSASLGGARNG